MLNLTLFCRPIVFIFLFQNILQYQISLVILSPFFGLFTQVLSAWTAGLEIYYFLLVSIFPKNFAKLCSLECYIQISHYLVQCTWYNGHIMYWQTYQTQQGIKLSGVVYILTRKWSDFYSLCYTSISSLIDFQSIGYSQFPGTIFRGCGLRKHHASLNRANWMCPEQHD